MDLSGGLSFGLAEVGSQDEKGMGGANFVFARVGFALQIWLFFGKEAWLRVGPVQGCYFLWGRFLFVKVLLQDGASQVQNRSGWMKAGSSHWLQADWG